MKQFRNCSQYRTHGWSVGGAQGLRVPCRTGLVVSTRPARCGTAHVHTSVDIVPCRSVPLWVVKASHGFSTLTACKMEAKTDVNIPGILKDIHL